MIAPVQTSEARIENLCDTLEAYGNREGTEAQLEATQSMLRAVLEALDEGTLPKVLELPEIKGFLEENTSGENAGDEAPEED